MFDLNFEFSGKIGEDMYSHLREQWTLKHEGWKENDELTWMKWRYMWESDACVQAGRLGDTGAHIPK